MIDIKTFVETNTLAYLFGGSVRKKKGFMALKPGSPECQFLKEKKTIIQNWKLKKQLDKSTASFCHHAAAWDPGMFYHFYLEKNHKIANNSTYTEAREKKAHIWNP